LRDSLFEDGGFGKLELEDRAGLFDGFVVGGVLKVLFTEGLLIAVRMFNVV
jgi:hypothetical protein